MTTPWTPRLMSSLLLGVALALAPAAHAADKAAKARAAFDLMDRQDFLDGIELANAALDRNDFEAADKALAEIKTLASTPEQEQLWSSASREVQNGRKRVAQEQAIAQAQREAEALRLAQQQAQKGGSGFGSVASFAAGMALGGVNMGNLDSTLKKQLTKAVVKEGINSLANRAAAPAQPAPPPAAPSPQSLAALQAAAAGGGNAAGAGAPEPNILVGSGTCPGYSNSNFRDYYESHKQEDEQLHSMCAAAFNYYGAYLNALSQGYSKQQAQPTYEMFLQTARVAIDFGKQGGAR